MEKHVRGQEESGSREAYRRGKSPKAVKAFSIVKESRHVLVQNVPAVGVQEDLLALFSAHGHVEECRAIGEEELPREQFTEVYLITFAQLSDARRAKRKCDDHNFMGAILHVTYAPEFETLEDTRRKLEQRRTEVLTRVQGTTGGAQHREPQRQPKRPLPPTTTMTTTTVATVPLSTGHDRRHKRPRMAATPPQPTSSAQSTLLAIRNKLSSVRLLRACVR